MRIGITGASGFIGGAIIARANAQGHEIIGFSRSPGKIVPGCEEVRDFSDPELADYSGLDSMIHLAGENILGIWTEGKKERIFNSRVEGTAALVRGLAKLDEADRPKSLVCASGVSFYGNRDDDVLDEDEDRGFSILSRVVVHWEAAAREAEKAGLRVAMPRIGFVLGRDGGALKLMRLIFKLCLGGKLGSGQQWLPWIHEDDVADIFLECVTHTEISGPVNCTSPNPVTNAQFTKELATHLKRPAFLPAPTFALKMLPGGMSEIFLDSMRVDPAVMRSHDFEFNFPLLEDALVDLT